MDTPAVGRIRVGLRCTMIATTTGDVTVGQLVVVEGLDTTTTIIVDLRADRNNSAGTNLRCGSIWPPCGNNELNPHLETLDLTTATTTVVVRKPVVRSLPHPRNNNNATSPALSLLAVGHPHHQHSACHQAGSNGRQTTGFLITTMPRPTRPNGIHHFGTRRLFSVFRKGKDRYQWTATETEIEIEIETCSCEIGKEIARGTATTEGRCRRPR